MSTTKKTPAKKRGRLPLAKGQVKAKIVLMRLHDADVKSPSTETEIGRQSFAYGDNSSADRPCSRCSVRKELHVIQK
jgi:hypothetical protein